jgi:glutathione synthase/RimK-type ligase-like ATP-grasp enzyme
VPKWQKLDPAVEVRPEDWGPYVIEKPIYGGRGANIRIRRTTRAGYIPPESLDPDHRGRRGLLIQEFIYTGEWPSSYRVVTFFGEPILCYWQQTDTRGKPLPHRFGFKDAGGGAAYISNTPEMKVRLVEEADVLELAAKSHKAAFPDIPLLSFDIVRDRDSGNLYVLETNPDGGGTFFSNRLATKVQRDNNVAFVKQFDGLELMAQILSDLTPRQAAYRFPFSAPASRQPPSSQR